MKKRRRRGDEEEEKEEAMEKKKKGQEEEKMKKCRRREDEEEEKEKQEEEEEEMKKTKKKYSYLWCFRRTVCNFGSDSVLSIKTKQNKSFMMWSSEASWELRSSVLNNQGCWLKSIIVTQTEPFTDEDEVTYET